MDTYEGDDENPLALHKYLYVSANPINKLDVSGMDEIAEFGVAQAGGQSIDRASDAAAYQALTNSLLKGAIGFGAVKAAGVAGAITLTLAGLILLAPIVSSFQGAPSGENVLLRNGHDNDSDQKALFAFGNTTGPRAPRIGKDIHPDAAGMVGPTDSPEGASTYANVQFAPLTGPFHGIKIGDVLVTDGLSVLADGQDVNPSSPHPQTHHTIYPSRRMTVQQFIDKFLGLPWQLAGRK